MIGKVDLVMWTKNGAETLPTVLKRINEVIPREFVNNRIIVDDHSTDNTREIAKSFGWHVIFNEGSGISDGANTALRHVTTEYFISFEQDILLAREWWQKIPRHISHKGVAIASGIRLSGALEAVAKIEEYAFERYRKAQETEKIKSDKFLRGKSLDNTIYKTAVIRSLGGFPKLPVSAGVDTVLAYLTYVSGYEWKVDYTVKSIHLRKGLNDELAHRYWYATCYDTISMMRFNKPADLKKTSAILFFSPLRGLHIAIKKRCPTAVYIYPLIRFNILRGIADSRKNSLKSFRQKKHL